MLVRPHLGIHSPSRNFGGQTYVDPKPKSKFKLKPTKCKRLRGSVICGGSFCGFCESAQKISRIYNAITVLKTHRTVVVSPEGKTYINTTGNNSMAKAGSGDVLAGMISGFAAQKKTSRGQSGTDLTGDDQQQCTAMDASASQPHHDGHC